MEKTLFSDLQEYKFRANRCNPCRKELPIDLPPTLHMKGLALKDNTENELDLSDFKEPPPPLDSFGPSLLKMFDESLVNEEEEISIRFNRDDKKNHKVRLSTKIWSTNLYDYERRCVLHSWLHYLLRGARTVDFDVEANDGFDGMMDLVIKQDNTITCLIQTIKDDIELLDHRHQIMHYAACILRDNPYQSPFSLILTDGNQFFIGLASWNSGFPQIKFDMSNVKYIRDEYNLFWNAVAFEKVEIEAPNYILNLYSGNRSVAVKVVEVIGKGSFSTVFLVENIVDELEVFALKVSNNNEMLVREKTLNQQIQEQCKDERIVIPIIGEILADSKLIALVYPLANPVCQSSWVKPQRVCSLTGDHYQQLWIKLNSLHRAGIAHRNILLDKVVLLNDEAYFIDLRYSCKLGVVEKMSGSLASASQRILDLIYREEDIEFEYKIDDDLESMFKSFLWDRFSAAIPSMSEKSSKRNEAEMYLRFWFHKCMFSISIL